ncbi:hypothetical protein SELMODRAFT_18224, partial [Selaginella moellendorffii]
LDIFKEMISQGIKPDESSFVLVLVACSHGGDAHVGINFFRSFIVDYGTLDPSKVLYGCIVDLLARGGYLVHAEDLILHMPFLPDS